VPLKYANNQSLTSTTALPVAVPTDNLILISTQTASASATISFTGINGTYDEYQFKFININPATDNTQFVFNGSTDSGSNYNVTKTSTFFHAIHLESGASAELGYRTSEDLAQSTAFQPLAIDLGGDSDEGVSGSLTLFSPSSTTYVKHFLGTTNRTNANDISINSFIAGYMNTTSAINAIQFKMASGNIDDGIIKLYGVKKS
jgi:hypothetical protein